MATAAAAAAVKRLATGEGEATLLRLASVRGIGTTRPALTLVVALRARRLRTSSHQVVSSARRGTPLPTSGEAPQATATAVDTCQAQATATAPRRTRAATPAPTTQTIGTLSRRPAIVYLPLSLRTVLYKISRRIRSDFCVHAWMEKRPPLGSKNSITVYRVQY